MAATDEKCVINQPRYGENLCPLRDRDYCVLSFYFCTLFGKHLLSIAVHIVWKNRAMFLNRSEA